MPSNKLPKPKKCKFCRAEYIPMNSLQKACSTPCAIGLARKAQKQADKKEAKAFRAETKRRKEAIKTIPQLAAEAQTAVNAWIRWRDRDKPCVSCGSSPKQAYGGTMDAGHYRSRGAAKHLRFNTFNIHAQCVKCNRYGSGMAQDYRIELIKRIGLDRVERLENDNEVRKFTKDYLRRIKQVFAKRLRQAKNRAARLAA